jgi:hypothetical protein
LTPVAFKIALAASALVEGSTDQAMALKQAIKRIGQLFNELVNLVASR